jgi:hypothetical protein
MHEYLSYTKLVYYDCIECKKRTPHVCIRCHYCYSCHPKIERIEKEIRVKMRSNIKCKNRHFLCILKVITNPTNHIPVAVIREARQHYSFSCNHNNDV